MTVRIVSVLLPYVIMELRFCQRDNNTTTTSLEVSSKSAGAAANCVTRACIMTIMYTCTTIIVGDEVLLHTTACPIIIAQHVP